ncbi:hypothetical protein ACFQV2_03595 [Actinokineospora soli]|uniref:Uncharacterized protein n=1 Tax=Actinokineospora soli TaxID=1048753 RepID=A0ABW2TJ58_9PSEU
MPLSDDELYTASRDMQDTVWAMVEATGMDDDMGLMTARLRHVNTMSSLSLDRMAAEYDRVSDVQLKITHSGDAKEELGATEHLLKDWRGMAAEEFDRKIQNIRSHIEFFAPVSTRLTYFVGGLYSLALHSRQSLYTICKETTAGALQVIDDQDAREAELQIAAATRSPRRSSSSSLRRSAAKR